MIHFEWPWAVVLILLPFIIHFFLKPFKRVEDSALYVPFIQESDIKTNDVSNIKGMKATLWIAIFSWVLLITSVMRPQWLGDFVEFPVSGRDIILAIDISGSMNEKDFIIDGDYVGRLSVSKKIAGEFIDRRIGDRLGLILFGDEAYLQTPLTFDRITVKKLLLESAIGLAGKKTAIGDAIGLAVKRLRHQKDKDIVLILLTDGANTAGVVQPIDAASLAKAEGLKIYTIGIGADEISVKTLFGTRRVNPSLDLDEKTLSSIADKTGGQYFRARDTEELEKIYALLDELEPAEKDSQQLRKQKALFYWPLGFSFLFLLLLLFVRNNFGRLN